MSGDRFTGAPASNGPPAPYPRQQNYSFNGRVLLMAAFLLFGLTIFFTLIRFLLTTCPLCRAEAELPKGNDKAEVAAQSSSSSSSSSAREPPQQALFGAGGTLIVTVQGGFPDTQRGVRGSTSG
ncbi:unnamed protein product [Triticum turgidum subsp. durum]|uniref:Uncharacterized protein n=1 Tax=Triticum turgidum subsp. durum TaxID=4567 RepID=A0A9R1RZ80_TRITD|nr:unnamed protein product [Triticum turgidum subsp. durum]